MCLCVCLLFGWKWKTRAYLGGGDEGHGLMHLKCWTYSRYFIIVDNYSFEKVEGAWGGVHVSSSPLMYFNISLCERQVSNTNVFIAEGGRILKLGEGNNIGRWTNNFLNLFKLSLFKYISMYVISLLCVVFFDHDLMIGQRDRET